VDKKEAIWIYPGSWFARSRRGQYKRGCLIFVRQSLDAWGNAPGGLEPCDWRGVGDGLGVLGRDEGGVLVFEGLHGAGEPALGKGCGCGIGEDVLVAVLDAGEDGAGGGFGGGFGNVEAAVHVGVDGAR